jgi:hypothetical protein
MTPQDVRLRKEQGLTSDQPSMLWVLDLCETLPKALTSLDTPDFRCFVCGQEEGHGSRCSVLLGEAVLEGRWKIGPRGKA